MGFEPAVALCARGFGFALAEVLFRVQVLEAPQGAEEPVQIIGFLLRKQDVPHVRVRGLPDVPHLLLQLPRRSRLILNEREVACSCLLPLRHIKSVHLFVAGSRLRRENRRMGHRAEAQKGGVQMTIFNIFKP